MASGELGDEPGPGRDCETMVVVMNALSGRAGPGWDAVEFDPIWGFRFFGSDWSVSETRMGAFETLLERK